MARQEKEKLGKYFETAWHLSGLVQFEMFHSSRLFVIKHLVQHARAKSTKQNFLLTCLYRWQLLAPKPSRASRDEKFKTQSRSACRESIFVSLTTAERVAFAASFHLFLCSWEIRAIRLDGIGSRGAACRSIIIIFEINKMPRGMKQNWWISVWSEFLLTSW